MAVYENASAHGVEFFPMFENEIHRAQLVRVCCLGVVVKFRSLPFCFELPAQWYKVGCEFAVFVVGVSLCKAVCVVALGLQPFAGKRGQGVAVVNVVGVVTVVRKVENAWHGVVYKRYEIFAHSKHEERAFQAARILEYELQYIVGVSFLARQHVCQVSVGVEPEYQPSVRHGKLRVVKKLPTAQVHEVEVAVARIAFECVTLDFLFVGEGYFSEWQVVHDVRYCAPKVAIFLQCGERSCNNVRQESKYFRYIFSSSAAGDKKNRPGRDVLPERF